jgi:maltose alpha-D-glucosyltransferase/alpha-amylase
MSRLNAAFAVLARPGLFERPEDQARVAALLHQRSALTTILGALAHAGEGSLMTRIHGDFHLGQVLVVNGDAFLIDFEGEPARPLEERRAKASPLRDVAGLLRSFGYAAATMVDRKTVASGPVSDERRDAFIAGFRARAPQVFLNAYREAVGETGEEMNDRLLDLFLIEKAAYELNYEAANRPTWLPVPLAGLAELVERVIGDNHGAR